MAQQTEQPRAAPHREASWLNLTGACLKKRRSAQSAARSVKFLAISANNLDEFFEFASVPVQQLEDGHNSTTATPHHGGGAGTDQDATPSSSKNNTPAGTTPAARTGEQEFVSASTNWTTKLAFVDDYCKGTRSAAHPVTVDPAHPFPRVINKACAALLRRRRRSSLTYTES